MFYKAVPALSVPNTVGLPSYGVSVFVECVHICRCIRVYVDMCVLYVFFIILFVFVCGCCPAHGATGK